MNYGKEAYCKISELENLINSGRQTASTVSETYDAEKGGRQTVAVYVGGNALISVTVDSEGAGRAQIYFGGAKAADVTAGGTSCVTFAVGGDGTVEIGADEGVTVKNVVVAVIGCGTLSGTATGKLVADECNGKIYAAAKKDGSLKLYGVEGGALTELCDIGDADDFDICAEDGALTVVTAARGKCSVVRDVGGTLYCAVSGGGSAVAIDRDSCGLVFARYDGRRVTVTRLSDELKTLASASCHGSPSVSGIAFVKRSPRARLIVSDGGKNLLRSADDGGCSYVGIKCAVTAGGAV